MIANQPDGPSRPDPRRGLVLEPLRALRPTVDGDELASRLCPPYDVIDPAQRAQLIASDPRNAVALILPETAADGDPYRHAAHTLAAWRADGDIAVDDRPALYVYEMREGAEPGTQDAGQGDAPRGSVTRGLVGALELRDPADGVVLPHENTMAGPVADRLALMTATEANLEPIYLVYDGGGATSRIVAAADAGEPIATATTPDRVMHRLWSVTDPAELAAIAADLSTRRALIADGHHRYATYRQLQQQLAATRGAGPWDYGLTLLVDSTSYGPQVHAIHRVLPGLALERALAPLAGWGLTVEEVADPQAGLTRITSAGAAGAGADTDRADTADAEFAAVLTDGDRSVVIADAGGRARAAGERQDETATLSDLDVTVLHRGLVGRIWGLPDTEQTLGYAHSISEAVTSAQASGGIAVLLRATPVAAVAAVAAAGARMPRKSTLFTPKPASGLVLRTFLDG